MPSLFRISLLAVTVVASSAHASFLSNYSDWQKWEPYGQAMYVQGLYDQGQADAAVGEESWVTAMRQGTSDCFQEQRLTAAMLTDAISKHYQNNVDDWIFPPAVVFTQVTRRICLRYINEQRAKVGLSAWKLDGGSLAAAFNKNAQ